jgi:predicted DNA-binding transcriptional regulator AlpA
MLSAAALWETKMRLLTKREVAARLGFHPEHVMRLARAGQFPKPIKLGLTENSATRFSEEEVDAWIGQRLAARDSVSA